MGGRLLGSSRLVVNFVLACYSGHTKRSVRITLQRQVYGTMVYIGSRSVGARRGCRQVQQVYTFLQSCSMYDWYVVGQAPNVSAADSGCFFSSMCMQGHRVCRYLFVRCDNEPAPWTRYLHLPCAFLLCSLSRCRHFRRVSSKSHSQQIFTDLSVSICLIPSYQSRPFHGPGFKSL